MKLRCRCHAEVNDKRALSPASDNAEDCLGQTRCAMARKRFLEAAQSVLTSMGLRSHNPTGPFYLGKALVHMELSDKAKGALKTAVSQNPDYPVPHWLLVSVYGSFSGDDARSEYHRALAREARQRIETLKAEVSVTPPESL